MQYEARKFDKYCSVKGHMLNNRSVHAEQAITTLPYMYNSRTKERSRNTKRGKYDCGAARVIIYQSLPLPLFVP